MVPAPDRQRAFVRPEHHAQVTRKPLEKAEPILPGDAIRRSVATRGLAEQRGQDARLSPYLVA